VKLLKEILRTAGWALFLVGSTFVLIALLQRPRSVAEFQAILFQIDGFYLMLIMVGGLVVASIISLLGRQEA
jgi:hypothetical protein